LPEGLHLRPAASIAELAAQLPGRLTVRYRDRSADGQSVLDLLSLGVPQGGEVVIEAETVHCDELLERLRQITRLLTGPDSEQF
jgi:phosphotransferase system HPr (HPr) family protein